jgi:hypothetical protein
MCPSSIANLKCGGSMKVRARLKRSREIHRLRRELERDGLPRIRMSLLVAPVLTAMALRQRLGDVTLCAGSAFNR